MTAEHINEEISLRIAKPVLYRSMVEIFEKYHIHPYDTQGSITKKENGYDITLKFSNSFSQYATKHINSKQAEDPDDELIQFFEETAEQCKARLISDYYKMVKP